jgi:hypothetical protein
MIEILGFAFLIAATLWDWRVKSSQASNVADRLKHTRRRWQ